MNSVSFITTIGREQLNSDFYSDENVCFLQNKITEILSKEYKQKVVIPRDSIIRRMNYVIVQRNESIPRMNQRVIMDICDEVRVHQLDVNKKLMWSDGYSWSQLLVDPVGETIKTDLGNIKLPNRLGVPKVGGTLQFYIT